MTFIVDSDDYLTSNAIETIISKYNTYLSEDDLCGLSFLRGTHNGGYLSDSGVPENGMKETFVRCRINRGIGGDMAEVWYTKCLKEYPFPEFSGEKFLGEDTVWIAMSGPYKMRFFNDVIYISDYLEDGLTKNKRKHNISSPNGCIERSRVFIKSKANLKAKIKAMLQYHIYGRFANKKVIELLNESGMKLLYLVLLLPAEVIFQ